MKKLAFPWLATSTLAFASLGSHAGDLQTLPAPSPSSQNQIATTAVLKALHARNYVGTDARYEPCQVSAESHDWGVLVNIAPADISFYLILDANAASAETIKNLNMLEVTTQYRADDPDESPDHFTITNTLTTNQEQGTLKSVQVQTFDSGIDVSQDAICNIQ